MVGCVEDEDSTGSHAELEDFCVVGFHPLGPEGCIIDSGRAAKLVEVTWSEEVNGEWWGEADEASISSWGTCSCS